MMRASAKGRPRTGVNGPVPSASIGEALLREARRTQSTAVATVVAA
jgi:hypothetical protein